MTFLELQKAVAAYLNRATTDFTVDSVDNLKQAINNAQERAQRNVDFYASLTTGYLPLTSLSANYKTAMLDGVGGSSVSVKKLASAHISEDFTDFIPLRGVDAIIRLGEDRGGVYALLLGDTLKLRNYAENVSGLYTIYYSKLAPLSADGDTNFLTENCSDWMMFQAIFELHYFMKEEDRIPQTAGILRDKWDSVLNWNDFMQSETDTTLD